MPFNTAHELAVPLIPAMATESPTAKRWSSTVSVTELEVADA